MAFKVADVGEAAMKEVDAMIRREKSEHFFVGLLKIMSTIRNRNCGVPMPPDLATVVANRVDLITIVSLREFATQLLRDSIHPHKCL